MIQYRDDFYLFHTSHVQIWQGSLAGWKLSPGPYTLPSNTQSAQKIMTDCDNKRIWTHIFYIKCMAFTTVWLRMGFTTGRDCRETEIRKCKANMLTSTHWAALPRHTDEVNTWSQTVYFRAGGHTIHAHTCHTWSWVCKPAAALCMLLSRINTTWEGKVSHWQTIPPVIRASISLFTSTTRTAGSWISHLMHTSKLRTLRNCTMHLSCLWEYHRSALQYKKGNMEKNKIYICKQDL